MSQSELARRLGTLPQNVNRWEAGGRRLDLETITQAEELMSLPRGTVFRLAGYVDDDGLVDVDSLPGWAKRAVRAILLDVEKDQAGGADGTSQVDE